MNSIELLLLRHAEALPPEPGQRDIERPLSSLGLAQAAAIADWLAERGLAPDRVLCSPALRTRQTLAALEPRLPLPPPQFEPGIYEATPGELCALLDKHLPGARRLLLVGHNPGLELSVALLSTGRSGDARGMPVASLAWLAVDAERKVEPGCARLLGLWSP